MARLRARSAVSACLFATGVILGGCATGVDDPAPPTGQSRSAIIGGIASPSANDFAIHIDVIGISGGSPICSGMLVAPTLVLTARHCVTSGLLDNSSSQCILGTDPYPAANIRVGIGADSASFRTINAVRTVVDFDTDDCSADIAGIELSEPVTNVTFPPLALDAPVKVADAVNVIGWGLTAEDDANARPTVRQQLAGTVLGTTAGTYQTIKGSPFNALAGVIVTNLTTCFGDSGAPLVDAKGAIVGVLGGGYYQASTGDNCIDGAAYFTPLSAQTSFVERLFQSVGTMPTREGHAAPASLGGTCAQNNECNSNFCVGIGPTSVCSKVCNVDADCGSGLTCTDSGQTSKVCLGATSPPPRDKSCAVAPALGARSHGSDGAVALAALALVAVARRRYDSRRRRAG